MNKHPQPNDGEFSAVIARLREMAVQAGDSLLLANGPPNPDAALLDLCADVMDKHREVMQAWEACREFNCSTVGVEYYWSVDGTAERKKLLDYAHRLDREQATLLRRAAKLHSTTSAGIYAKALIVNASRTGAAKLAMSLARDLIEHKTLRAALWSEAVL